MSKSKTQNCRTETGLRVEQNIYKTETDPRIKQKTVWPKYGSKSKTQNCRTETCLRVEHKIYQTSDL